MIAIDTRTKLVGLLGYPLGHSFSPAMQNAAFEKAGLNFLYLPIEVVQEGLGDVIEGIRRMNFAGFNVTIPYKIKVMEYMDELDDLAKLIGAVNTAVITEGRTKGYNTDGEGFVRSLEEKTGLLVKSRRVLVLGSGGGARAITMTLAARGAEHIYICNRTSEKAEGLCKDINTGVRECAEALPMETGVMAEVLKEIDILVNATSIGMYPNKKQIPLDLEPLKGDTVVCDIVYNPPRTEFLDKATKKGCTTVNGLGMLAYQGAEAFTLWTGLEAPVEEMLKALSQKISIIG
jgi:shikimate dehydrogenase